MKAKIQKDCVELWSLLQNQNKLKKKIQADIQQYAEEKRQFANGEIVMVCNKETGKEIGKGMVADVRTSIYLEPLFLKDFSDITQFDKYIDNLRYEIFAVKRNGNRSNKHFFQAPHYISDSGTHSAVFIKKI